MSPSIGTSIFVSEAPRKLDNNVRVIDYPSKILATSQDRICGRPWIDDDVIPGGIGIEPTAYFGIKTIAGMVSSNESDDEEVCSVSYTEGKNMRRSVRCVFCRSSDFKPRSMLRRI